MMMVQALTCPLDLLHVVPFLQQIKAESGPDSYSHARRAEVPRLNPLSLEAGEQEVGPCCVSMLRLSQILNKDIRSAHLPFATSILAYQLRKQEVLHSHVISFSFHMSVSKLIMRVHIVHTTPSTFTSLRASSSCYFLRLPRQCQVQLASWLETIRTPWQLNFGRVGILTQAGEMVLRLSMPGLWFLYLTMDSAYCVVGVINAVYSTTAGSMPYAPPYTNFCMCRVIHVRN